MLWEKWVLTHNKKIKGMLDYDDMIIYMQIWYIESWKPLEVVWLNMNYDETYAYSMMREMWGKYVNGVGRSRSETERGKESQMWPFVW